MRFLLRPPLDLQVAPSHCALGALPLNPSVSSAPCWIRAPCSGPHLTLITFLKSPSPPRVTLGFGFDIRIGSSAPTTPPQAPSFSLPSVLSPRPQNLPAGPSSAGTLILESPRGLWASCPRSQREPFQVAGPHVQPTGHCPCRCRCVGTPPGPLLTFSGLGNSTDGNVQRTMRRLS